MDGNTWFGAACYLVVGCFFVVVTSCVPAFRSSPIRWFLFSLGAIFILACWPLAKIVNHRNRKILNDPGELGNQKLWTCDHGVFWWFPDCAGIDNQIPVRPEATCGRSSCTSMPHRNACGSR